MRPSSFKRDGWILIIPALLVLSGLSHDPLHSIAFIGAMVGCLVGALVTIVGVIRQRRLSKTRQHQGAET